MKPTEAPDGDIAQAQSSTPSVPTPLVVDSTDVVDEAPFGVYFQPGSLKDEPATTQAELADHTNLADVILDIEAGETSLFEAAIVAFHAGEFQQAESLFLEEAERTLDAAPQRAAIAFRQAALAARQSGNLDGSDHWMRLAGREYLRVSEDDRTPLPFVREAAVMAAKCFLSVENLHVAAKGLHRAQAIAAVMSVDDDLLAGVPGIPFHRDAVVGGGRSASVHPATGINTARVSTGPPTSDDAPQSPEVLAGRSHRLWHRLLRRTNS